MLPAWSRKLLPLVFINLKYGLLNVLMEKPLVWFQGSDISLNTTYSFRGVVSPSGQLFLSFPQFIFLSVGYVITPFPPSSS